jgi:serine/threonine protein kinase
VPGVVRVSGYFEENDTAYIVMEYVKGQTLSAWLRANKVMPARDMMKHMLQIVRGLEKIHRLGILHLDISPENIMVREDGSFVLIDFGAARELSGRENRVRESKSCYSPPEQRRGACVGPYSDVYALCATMYHCVVGHAPDDCTLGERTDLLKSRLRRRSRSKGAVKR